MVHRVVLSSGNGEVGSCHKMLAQKAFGASCHLISPCCNLPTYEAGVNKFALASVFCKAEYFEVAKLFWGPQSEITV